MSADPHKSKEAEANRFAACLLMPKKHFLADIQRFGAPELGHVVTLANRYCVSKEAAARRFVGLSRDACAFVFSQNGVVRRCCKSDGFPFLTVKSGGRLPADCQSTRVKLAAGTTSDWQEVEQETWFDRERRGKVLFEQFLQQANGYRITMLTLDDADAAEPDDDEDYEGLIEKSWAAPRLRK